MSERSSGYRLTRRAMSAGMNPWPAFDVRRELADLDEQPVIEDGAFLVVPPQAGRVGRFGGQGRENRLEPGVQARLMHGSHQGFELGQGAPGFLALAAAGKEHLQAAGGPACLGQNTVELGG